MKMKKEVLSLLLGSLLLLGACSKAERISYNVSREADDINIVRKITVINAIKGEVLYQVTGKMSITADTDDHQLEIIAEDENGGYKKHFIGLSDNVTYVVEDITGKKVSDTRYTIIFNPKMILPVDAKLAE